MGKRHSDELRGAVMAALLEGQSIGHIAKEYRISTDTVWRWRKQAKSVLAESDDVELKREIGNLALEYLRANLKALKAQVDLFAESDYLRKQGASENAVLHGVQADKAFRILEAAEAAGWLDDESADPAPEATGDR